MTATLAYRGSLPDVTYVPFNDSGYDGHGDGYGGSGCAAVLSSMNRRFVSGPLRDEIGVRRRWRNQPLFLSCFYVAGLHAP